jgi:hypothetical protein
MIKFKLIKISNVEIPCIETMFFLPTVLSIIDNQSSLGSCSQYKVNKKMFFVLVYKKGLYP